MSIYHGYENYIVKYMGKPVIAVDNSLYGNFLKEVCSSVNLSVKPYYTKKNKQYYTDLENKRLNDKYRNLIKWVKFNDKKKATTVKWSDDTITVVKVSDGDEFDPYIGIAMCMAKKLCGNRTVFNDIIQKWGDTYKSEDTTDYDKLAEDYGVKKYTNTVKYKDKKCVKKEKKNE